MEGQSLTDFQLQELKKCVENVRLGNSILFASSVLFLFDYLLTLADEVRYLRRSKRLSIGTGAFIVSRYGALLAAILAIPAVHDLRLDSVNTLVRVAPIAASELILAARTWVIWGRTRTILWSLSVVIPALIIVGKNVATNRVRPLITPELADLCSATFGDNPVTFVVPYLLTIIYEIVTLSLSLFRIAQLRRNIPKTIRSPLLSNLWRDGVVYFMFMLFLSVINISIILQPDAPQLRTGSASLQAVLHSIVASRIVLHLGGSKNPRVITSAITSGYSETVTDIQFNSRRFSMGRTVDGLPVSRRWEEYEEG
ncbi:hypothetical protein E1B28_013407 [Marasmius oreades]|uniref:DUF6533 domain-containing protein n=1 Tax=Marasmius oreades TaxID=181124 RepID=A0A9P7RQK0_9AGAR|nr:uncharacterized protein E1B28_013407 [Marasmius oreades]KAG7087441.1 hypothetical protein E1B28_013407 [Marasmius oreades]